MGNGFLMRWGPGRGKWKELCFLRTWFWAFAPNKMSLLSFLAFWVIPSRCQISFSNFGGGRTVVYWWEGKWGEIQLPLGVRAL